jgi:hypothetical protein
MSPEQWSYIPKDTNLVKSEHAANNEECGINLSILNAI